MMLVYLAEYFGSVYLFLLEDTVEVRDVVEATGIAYLGYRSSGAHKHLRGVAQPHINHIVGDRPACAQLEEAAEGSRRHSGKVGEDAEPYVFLIMLVDVVLHFLYAPAVARWLDGDKSAAREATVVPFVGKLMQYSHKLEHATESGFLLDESIQAVGYLGDALSIERDAPAAFLKHLAKLRELILGKQVVAEDITFELYGNLPYLVAHAFMLQPSMLHILAYEHEIEITDSLHRIADNTPCPRGIDDEIEFEIDMPMDRICE